MEGWQQDWFKALESVADGVEKFFLDVTQDVNEFLQVVAEVSEEWVEQFEESLDTELDQWDEQLDDWIEPMLFTFLGLESAIDDAMQPVNQTVDPILNQHPICMGCRHYHGQNYGGHMLVCAMHPYGIVDGAEDCPDKELHQWMKSDFSDDN